MRHSAPHARPEAPELEQVFPQPAVRRRHESGRCHQPAHARDRCAGRLKAKDIREIDVRGKTSIADLLVIASGTSARHVKSIADEVVKFAKKAGVMPLGVEGEQEAEWVLVDLGDVIVHVMLPRIREFYGLERLWTVGDRESGMDAANAG